MRSVVAIAVLTACASASSTPPAGAVAPPAPPRAAQVLRYTVVTSGRASGSGEVSVAPDGTRRAHLAYNDRGRGPDLRTELRVDRDCTPRYFRATGTAYEHQPVDERLDERGGQLAWRSAHEHGEAKLGAGYYLAQNLQLDASLVRCVLRAPGAHIKLLPLGEAWAESVVEQTIDGKRLRQVAIAGVATVPVLLWIDDRDELFASVDPWISIIRAGSEAQLPALLAADTAWQAARAARIAKDLAHQPPSAGLALTHAQVFDAARRVIVPDQTVIVVGDRITRVGGPNTAIPAGAQVIDARGRTLVPGFWDMHVHVFDNQGPLALATGVTTVRDLANDTDALAARIARIAAGAELGPTILRAGLIDGTGRLAGPTGVLVDTPAQAIAAVNKFADQGFVQIKMYSSLAPELAPIIARAAHARGLRVSGHVPNHMNAAQAVEAGFDELQHMNFLFLQFLAGPDDDTRTPLRYVRVAERGAALDLDGADVHRFLDLLAKHATVVDPTLAIFEMIFTTAPDELDAISRPYRDRLPAQATRSGGGPALDAPGDKRATYRASFAAMLKMLKRLYDRGIPIVAGTDAGGLAYPRELELYVAAGIPAPEVLALATLGAARIMRQDREVGSITAGKRADLVLLDGDPTRDISAVRNTDLVIARGVVYDADELYSAAGILPRKR